MGTATLGRYVLYEEIAAGGMATVHLGRLLGDGGFSRTVAIKRLHPHMAKDPEFVGMFLDEARLAARIRHPNVIPTLDVVSMSGEVFLVMEYVHGESLSRLWRTLRDQGRRIPVPIACSIMGDVLAGLHAAHEATSDRGEPLGIVHRDVSPQNVLVGSDGVARLLDFGVAKAALRYQSTQQGQIKGKLAYMAPEQIQLKPVDRRSDVFAASIVLWEALTGKRLFDTPEPAATIAAIIGAEIAPPSALAPEIPTALDEVVLRGLERQADRRFATALEMARALYEAAPASNPHALADWMRQTAAESLAERSQRVARVERDSGVGASPDGEARMAVAANVASEAPTDVSASLAAPEPPRQAASVAEPSAPARKRRSVATWLAAVTAVVAISAITVAQLGSRPDTSVSAAPQVGDTARPEPTPEVAPPASATSSVEVAAAAETAAASSTSAASSQASVAGPSGGRGKAAPQPRGPNCQPNFSVDERGIKHFKPECLHPK